MKSIILSIIILFGTFHLNGQKLTKDAFLGTWKVVDTQIISEMTEEMDENGKIILQQMRDGFIGTVFNFKSNGEFDLKFRSTIPGFMKELETANNTNWQIEDGRMIVIGTKEDGYSLMGIMVGVKDDKKFFIIDESPFILEVEEQ